jgi:hypothetical protein
MNVIVDVARLGTLLPPRHRTDEVNHKSRLVRAAGLVHKTVFEPFLNQGAAFKRPFFIFAESHS